jgi:predicted nuclease with TOPRIM domain
MTVIRFASKFNQELLSLEHKLQSIVSVLSEDLRKEILSLFEEQKRMCRNELEEWQAQTEELQAQTEELQAQLDELRQSIHSVKPKEQGPPDEVSPPDDSSPPDEPSRLNEQHPKPSKRGKKRGGER